MLLESDRVTFTLIQKRLLEELRQRLRNGDFTERGLARIVGISQPHIHNVLKGVRSLSPDLGDQVISGLDLSLMELLGADELGEALMAKQARRLGTHSAPVLVGKLGPEEPFPNWRATAAWVAARDPELRALRRPAFVQLGADPALPAAWSRFGFGLLDFDESSRSEPGLPGWYALRWRGGGYLRQLRLRDRRLAVLGQRTLEHVQGPEAIDVEAGSMLQIVKARVVWIGPDPMSAGWQAQSGLWLPRAARS
jgi:plasmid maintenance system antidote protein VapI